MEDTSWHNLKNTNEADSAVLDMEKNDDDDGSQFHETSKPNDKPSGSMMDNIRQKMGDNVTQMVWQAGTQSAKKAWSVYGNIDVLRPYFDVEPKEVQMRLLYSLIPLRPNDQGVNIPKELYGPLMVVLTLIALLLYQMKSADHIVEEGTLMGSAFGVCFMYWFGASSMVWFMSYVCNVRMALLQILSMMGYALFGHCIVLFLGTAIHTSHDHMFFYLLWAVIGGLASLRMASIILSRTRGRTERMIIIGTIATFHLLFLLYLHFAYHTIVEEISDALNAELVPVPAEIKPGEMLKDAALPKAEGISNNLTQDLVQAITNQPDSHVEVFKAAVNDTGDMARKMTGTVVKGEGILLDKLKLPKNA